MTDSFNWQHTYDLLHTPEATAGRRPLIGITGNYADQTATLAEGYYRSVFEAGGMPVILPPCEPDEMFLDLLDRLDGIIFSGGGDINPLYLSEQPIPQLHGITPLRDRQELVLARMAFDRQLPMLGICKGIQIIAAALGGTLYQDINSQQQGVTIKHSQDMVRTEASHTVSICPDTLLYNIYGATEIAVNSFHHQAVKSVPAGFRVSALSPDGVIETIESTEWKSVIGVQWHPECFILDGNSSHMP
ncbi:MAG: gamma-glutamyl-gamma-aminobutyrate hydrolase family protein, partial [Bacteroidaceae bacterium]|nr:gamma-glutamyl-gamma-aminobutyrate hydrolase family protein [Bacteroidaceae bacterium]